MVHQIIKSKYRIFIESLILSLLILVLGILIGYFIESYRANNVIADYKNFEVESLDLKLQNYYFQIMENFACDEAMKQNILFADQIYDRGLALEKYEEQGDLMKSSFLTEKKRYVLLKMELWLNTVLLKNKCANVSHTVVYFYTQTPDMAKKAEQNAVSKTLGEIKEKQGNNIILIPIAGDLGLSSVDMQREIYNITYLPSILIDEKIKIEGFKSIGNIEGYLK